MKPRNPLLLAALLAPTSSTAHYLFGRFTHNAQTSHTWEYTREVSPRPDSDAGLALFWPLTDPTHPDLRCGRNASRAWARPATAVVRAGAEVGFAWGEVRAVGVERGAYHPGFAGVFMSRVGEGGGLDAYEGDGDWFKILQVVNRTDQSVDFNVPENRAREDRSKSIWGTYLIESWNFTIPATTPPGKYLLRWEHIFPNAQDAQFYVNCAHVEVLNDGPVGTPGPLVKIPGLYVRGQKDVYFSSYEYGIPRDLSRFVPPAPRVWEG